MARFASATHNMATTIGSTGNSGCPSIRITIAGVFGLKGQEFDATVDTGFTGFVSMPIMSAFPLGLPLYGTTSVQFGDGSTASRFTVLCEVTLGDESKTGIAILEPSTTEILIGMELIKRFEKSLVMHRGILLLMDQTEIDKGLADAGFIAPMPNLSPAPAAPDSVTPLPSSPTTEAIQVPEPKTPSSN